MCIVHVLARVFITCARLLFKNMRPGLPHWSALGSPGPRGDHGLHLQGVDINNKNNKCWFYLSLNNSAGSALLFFAWSLQGQYVYGSVSAGRETSLFVTFF